MMIEINLDLGTLHREFQEESQTPRFMISQNTPTQTVRQKQIVTNFF